MPTRVDAETDLGGTMKQISFQLTDELFAAINSASGDKPRNPWLESQLWRLKAIRDGASTAGVTNPQRPMEGRGGNRREKKADK